MITHISERETRLQAELEAMTKERDALSTMLTGTVASYEQLEKERDDAAILLEAAQASAGRIAKLAEDRLTELTAQRRLLEQALDALNAVEYNGGTQAWVYRYVQTTITAIQEQLK